MKKVLAVIGAAAIAALLVPFVTAQDQIAQRANSGTNIAKSAASIIVNTNFNRLGGWIINNSATTTEVNVKSFTWGNGVRLQPAGSITFNFTTTEHQPVFQGAVWGLSDNVANSNSISYIEFLK